VAHAGVPDAVEHAAESGGGDLPQFVIGSWPGQIFWLAVSFAILYFVLSRSLLPRIGAVIEDRRDKIADDLDEAGRLQRQATDARERHEKALADARAKAHTIAGETRDRLAKELGEEARIAEAAFAKKAAEAEGRIRAATETALANVKAVAGEAADALVERLAGMKPKRDAVTAALDAAERS
jgi:F-type H+-transporting ATPase subunit b